MSESRNYDCWTAGHDASVFKDTNNIVSLVRGENIELRIQCDTFAGAVGTAITIADIDRTLHPSEYDGPTHAARELASFVENLKYDMTTEEKKVLQLVARAIENNACAAVLKALKSNYIF